MAGCLYIVPTPVGNMADMSPRAIEILRKVSVVYAEDTRTSSVLMRHFGIETPMLSHHKYNEHESYGGIVDRIVAGENIALISDAGTPGISDPGFLLSRECRRAGVNVITLPGPTAFVPALVNSGLPCDRFCFQGFLPVKKGRTTRIQEIADSYVTNIVYESPLRLSKTLRQLADVCGDNREASVSREISKIHETTVRATLKELADFFSMNTPKGEIVIIIAPKTETKGTKIHINKYRSEN
ncbi:MAG: 16S rRNA (cytidine(1402)-2'-O)-methyltransferase [Bacteroidales bacterium]|nr:16S rRNA (cytidine(1402)-2'-O)-methyltransferase [Bacteroidales bacterium]